MKYLAILKDSFYETIDYKIFYVLIGLSLALVAICGLISFPRQPLETALNKNFAGAMTVSDIEVLQESRYSNLGRYRFLLKAQQAARLGDLERQLRGPDGKQVEDVMLEQASKFLAQSVLRRQAGFYDVQARELVLSPEGQLQGLRVETEINWAELPNGHQMVFLFGLWKRDLTAPVGFIIAGIQIAIIDYVAGWAGLIIAVVVSAGFVPNMLRKGTVEMLLVKPISRPLLLLYKYMGGLTFVLFNAVVLIGASWVVFGLTLGSWTPWYLASIGVLMFYFAVLYSLSVLVGVLTRSSLAAILITLGFWMLVAIIGTLHSLAHDVRMADNFPETLTQAIDTAHFILPRTGDLSALNQYALLEANGLKTLLDEEKRQAALSFSWQESLLTSGGFIVVMLSLACWRFARRDY